MNILIYFVVFLLGFIAGIWLLLRFIKKNAPFAKTKTDLDRTVSNYRLMHGFAYVNRSDISLSYILWRNGIHRIAVYGLNEVGKYIIDTLQRERFDIAYIVDKKADKEAGCNLYQCMPFITPDKIKFQYNAFAIDAFLVASDFYYIEIKNDLRDKFIAGHDEIRIISALELSETAFAEYKYGIKVDFMDCYL